MNNTGVIIGLTGRFGAGCTTMSLFMTQEEDFKYFSLSDVLKEEARRRKKDTKKFKKSEARKVLQDCGDALRNENPTALALPIIRELKKENNYNVVVDSIRNPAEVDAFRNNFPNFTLVAVDAETEVRWSRLGKIYNNERDRFDLDEERDAGVNQPNYGQQVKRCIEIADVQISNNIEFFLDKNRKDRKAIDEFGQKLADYVNLIRNPGSRKPTFDEICMHYASSVALRSNCLKRQVGAVIVTERHIHRDKSNDEKQENIESYLLATGCNNVPIGEGKCKRICYRDEKKKEFLSEAKFCKSCGEKLELGNYKCMGCRFDNSKFPGKLLDICRSVHAEEAAILQSAKLGGTSLEGTKIYTTTFPCMLCCKKIINAGIKGVVYSESYPMEESQAIDMFRNCNVKVKKFEGINCIAFNKFFKKIDGRNIGFNLF